VTTSARIRSQPFLAKPEFQKLKYIFNIQYSELRENSVFRARASCSKILNDKKYFNTVKNFRATLFFKASASCSNILNGKKYIQYSEKFHGKLCFPGQGENNFNTVYSASNQCFPLLGNLSPDWDSQHLLGSIWGIDESRDFLGKWHFLGCGKIFGHTFLSDVKFRVWFTVSYRKKNQCTNCMKVIHYIFLIR